MRKIYSYKKAFVPDGQIALPLAADRIAEARFGQRWAASEAKKYFPFFRKRQAFWHRSVVSRGGRAEVKAREVNLSGIDDCIVSDFLEMQKDVRRQIGRWISRGELTGMIYPARRMHISLTKRSSNLVRCQLLTAYCSSYIIPNLNNQNVPALVTVDERKLTCLLDNTERHQTRPDIPTFTSVHISTVGDYFREILIPVIKSLDLPFAKFTANECVSLARRALEIKSPDGARNVDSRVSARQLKGVCFGNLPNSERLFPQEYCITRGARSHRQREAAERVLNHLGAPQPPGNKSRSQSTND